MPLRNLNNADMLLLTRMALEEHRAAFEAAEGQRAILRALEGLLPELVRIQAQPEDDSAAAAAEEGSRLDGEHDRLLRGLHGWLEVQEVLLDADRAAQVARLRGRLFPGGLSMTQRTYVEEATNAQLAAAELDADDRALLRASTLPDGRTALDVCEAWFRAGEALEQFERRRLNAANGAGAPPASQFEVRNQWVRVLHTLEGIVALPGASPNPFLDAIRTAEARADQRAGRSATSSQPAAPQPIDA